MNLDSAVAGCAGDENRASISFDGNLSGDAEASTMKANVLNIHFLFASAIANDIVVIVYIPGFVRLVLRKP